MDPDPDLLARMTAEAERARPLYEQMPTSKLHALHAAHNADRQQPHQTPITIAFSTARLAVIASVLSARQLS